MAVSFFIPSQLREYAGGRARVRVDAEPPNVGEALQALWTLYPELRSRVTTERGDVRQHVNVFVGADSIRHTGGLETKISGDAEITIVPAVSGG